MFRKCQQNLVGDRPRVLAPITTSLIDLLLEQTGRCTLVLCTNESSRRQFRWFPCSARVPADQLRFCHSLSLHCNLYWSFWQSEKAEVLRKHISDCLSPCIKSILEDGPSKDVVSRRDIFLHYK